MAKRKKHILTLEPEINFDVVGVCTHHSDYRLAWAINEQLGLKLVKCDDYIMTDKKGEESSNHSMFEFEDQFNRINYYLIKNKSEGQYLVKEKAVIDYLLFLCDNHAVETEELVRELKKINCVLGAYTLNVDECASMENIDLN